MELLTQTTEADVRCLEQRLEDINRQLSRLEFNVEVSAAPVMRVHDTVTFKRVVVGSLGGFPFPNQRWESQSIRLYMYGELLTRYNTKHPSIQ